MTTLAQDQAKLVRNLAAVLRWPESKVKEALIEGGLCLLIAAQLGNIEGTVKIIRADYDMNALISVIEAVTLQTLHRRQGTFRKN